MKRRAICAARASSPRQRLQGEFEPHGVNDFEQRVRAGCALAREAFVQTFTRQARIARQLGHATGAGNVAQCACQLRGVVVLQHLAQIFGNFLFIAQVVGHIKWLGLAGRQISLQRPQGRWF